MRLTRDFQLPFCALAVVLLLVSCAKHTTEPQRISLEQAEGIVLSNVLGGSDSGKVVYELPDEMKAGTLVSSIDSAYAAPTDSWFFFIDDQPGYRWVHPCRYAFVCCLTGQSTVVNEQIPPVGLDTLRLVVFD